MSIKTEKNSIITALENSNISTAIRSGLLAAIPILMTGSFALILWQFPIDVWQTFIKSFASGLLESIFSWVFNATFGFLSVYMVLTISYFYGNILDNKSSTINSAPIAALISFVVITGLGRESFNISTFGVKGMFSAIFSAILGTRLFIVLSKKIKISIKLYAEGADINFNRAISVIFPILLVTIIFVFFNFIVSIIFHVESFNALFIQSAKLIFSHLGRSCLSGFLFVLISSTLWFFGIHGSDVLEDIALTFFSTTEGLGTEILTKTFFDVFVFMGGCGSAICLLISILLFSKKRSNLKLAKMAAFPMLFNINELMVFGFPVILNPSLFIPFILCPISIFFISYLAFKFGLVPIPIKDVGWTTPVIIGGLECTNSIRGAILQVVNIIVGVFIYHPFVVLFDKEKDKIAMRNFTNLINVLKQSEENRKSITLTTLHDNCGAIAKVLASDIEHGLKNGDFKLFYQAQFDYNNNCIGAEALLRWKHEQYGMMYPPLMVKIAAETGCLLELDKYVLSKVVEDKEDLYLAAGHEIKICVNVSCQSIQSDEFEDFLAMMVNSNKIKKGQICLEITEQMELLFDDKMEARFARIKKLGYLMAIDDFSMGFTSMNYLKTNQFDLVKLDGSLVKGMKDNPHCKDIIESIVHLSKSLNFSVLAEFVETEKQRDDLENIGCNKYQGYLYSQAVPISNFAEKISKKMNK